METETVPTSFTVDEDGDLILLVGAGTRILVSSKAMTLASKVFKAMLSNSTFKEGRELAESAAKNVPYELPLPDDDVHAMIVLCQVIHHQARRIAVGTVTMALLEQVAIVTNKYACGDVVGLASRSWLEQYDNDSGEDRIVAISHLLGNAEIFRSASRRVLMKSGGATIRTKVDPDSSLPDRVFDELETRRLAANYTVAVLIAEELDAMQQGFPGLNFEHGRSRWDDQTPSTLYSQHDAERVQVFTQMMREQVKWPLDLHRRSLNDTFDSLRAIANSVEVLAGEDDPLKVNCTACQTTIQDQVRTIMAKADDLIKGLCLDCVQAPEGLGKDCRVQH